MSVPDAMASGGPAVVTGDSGKGEVADAPINAGPTTTAADQADAASIRTGSKSTFHLCVGLVGYTSTLRVLRTRPRLVPTTAG